MSWDYVKISTRWYKDMGSRETGVDPEEQWSQGDNYTVGPGEQPSQISAIRWGLQEKDTPRKQQSGGADLENPC